MSQSKFFPAVKTTKPIVDLYAKKFDCIPERDKRIRSDWNSNLGRSLHIVFNKCSDSDICKSDEEIEKFIQGTFVMVLYN